jgi:DNA-directed RNA polymerase beta' subunit
LASRGVGSVALRIHAQTRTVDGRADAPPAFRLRQRRYSVVGIETSETYEKGRPKPKGLSDPRLGTLDRSMKCLTDGANATDCPGYFGHLELAKPVFHVGFMTVILKVLRCVSVASSKLLLAKARAACVCAHVCARAPPPPPQP